MRKFFGLIAAAALLAAACGTTETRVAPAGEAHAKEASAADAVPANVLEAAKDAVPGLVVTGTESEVEGGVRVYEVMGTADGATYEIEVTADGKVAEIEKGGDDGEDEDDE